MPVSFQILSDHGLTYVRYEGVATLDESMDVFAQYAVHPDCRPGLKQLVDLSRITQIKFDFPKLMALQAQKADVFMSGPSETLIVYYAPNPQGRSIAQLVLKSWEPFDSVVPIIVDQEVEALAILGLPATSFSELLASTFPETD